MIFFQNKNLSSRNCFFFFCFLHKKEFMKRTKKKKKKKTLCACAEKLFFLLIFFFLIFSFILNLRIFLKKLQGQLKTGFSIILRNFLLILIVKLKLIWFLWISQWIFFINFPNIFKFNVFFYNIYKNIKIDGFLKNKFKLFTNSE